GKRFVFRPLKEIGQMKIGILGTGVVGKTLGSALSRRGHDVMLGTRDVRRKLDEKPTEVEPSAFRDWLSKNKKIRLGSFAETAAHGELLINATAGHGSINALSKVKPVDLKNKILIDISNPLGPSGEGPVKLFVSNDDSLAEMIQRAHPGVLVVKSLNTVTAYLQANPAGLAGGDHDIFVAGNDPAARDRVARFLREEFGWRTVIDLGDLTAARGLEMMILAWIKIWEALGTSDFNYKIVR
ncbi:MAG: NADPH-dependent F420 reductase, partial [Candidatus Aminicenantes bacterium RBG_16_66_30]